MRGRNPEVNTAQYSLGNVVFIGFLSVSDKSRPVLKTLKVPVSLKCGDM